MLLNLSCTKNKATEKLIKKSEIVKTSKTDTLNFTSGIRSIFQDRKGNYWFGSLEEGVAVYDGNYFTYFTTKDGLTDNKILTIQEDKNGIIWFSTLHGVSSYDGKTITNHTIMKYEALQSKWMISENDLWFSAGIKEGIYRYDGQRVNYLAFPNLKVANSNSIYAVTSLSSGLNNMIWIGTYAGVIGYNGSDFTIINDATIGHDTEDAPLHIRSILEDSKGRLWIGNNGIGVLLKEGTSISNFSEENNLIHPTSKRRGEKSLSGTLEHVFTITEDNKGNIWFGDRDTGIWKYDGKSIANFTKEHGLTNDFALSIYEDKNGELLFGTGDGNIFKFNGKTFEKKF